MRISLLPLILMVSLILSTQTISASSNLEISNTSDFSSSSTDFNGGETIFVRIKPDSLGNNKGKLNIRDNQYILVNSYQMNKEGNYFSATIPTPYAQGYYSLEARIEGEGYSLTSVETIRVGNPTEANVKVNIQNSVGVSSTDVLGEKEGTEGTSGTENIEEIEDGSEVEVYRSSDSNSVEEEKSFGQYLVSIIREVLDFLWPF